VNCVSVSDHGVGVVNVNTNATNSIGIVVASAVLGTVDYIHVASHQIRLLAFERFSVIVDSLVEDLAYTRAAALIISSEPLEYACAFDEPRMTQQN
jgi:hypothetical protein